MKRRDLLKFGGAAVAAGLTGRLYAAPESGPRFLLVFLRGGYDSCNLLIPYTSSFYYEVRPTIAVAKPDAASSIGALQLNADWALAPAVRETIGALYSQRQVAFVPFAGTDDLTRSHFETQDSIELGQPTGGARNYRSGFLGRLSDTLSGKGTSNTSIAFTDALPLSFEGTATVPNLSLKNVGKPQFDDRQSKILSDMYAGHHLQAAVSNGLELRHEVAQEMAEEMVAANRNAINSKGFELEAERMGRLMRDKYRIGFIDVGGWDTHVGEGAGQGVLGHQSRQPRHEACKCFRRPWEPSGTTPWWWCCRSSVARSARTATAVPTMVTAPCTGCWAARSTAGQHPRGPAETVRATAQLFQDRDYPVLNDYRAVLGGLFRTMWGLSPSQSSRIFPADRARRLETGLMRAAPLSARHVKALKWTD